MKLTIRVPNNVFDSIMDLQQRILRYEVEPEAAQAEMTDLIAPFTHYMPTPDDETTILREQPLISIPAKEIIRV